MSSISDAADFGGLVQAIQFAREELNGEAELVLSYDHPELDVCVPLGAKDPWGEKLSALAFLGNYQSA